MCIITGNHVIIMIIMVNFLLFFCKVDMPFHIPGTVVRVQDDIAIVHNLQTIGPGWVDDMALVS